jgi:hypothetical protein
MDPFFVNKSFYLLLVGLQISSNYAYICVTNDQGYAPRVLSTSRSFPHSTQNTKDLATRTPLQIGGELRKGEHYLLH